MLCFFVTNCPAQTKQDKPYNRFQYHSYKWQAFHTKAFHVYFTQGSDSLGSFISRELPVAMKKIKYNMGTSILKTPNVIIYPSTDQLYESNIGSYETEPNTLPTFIAKGTRLVIAYNGDYEQLKQQLYEALAREVWESQLMEGLAQQAKGVLGTEEIPSWYKEGAIRYFATQWPVAAEDELRRTYRQQHFNSWQQCIAYQPKLSGQAFCYFLTDQYYPLAAMNLYAQIRKKKSLVRAVRLITKKPLDTLLVQCNAFYTKRFITDSMQPDTLHPVTKQNIPHKKGIVKNVQVSPDGQHVAYVVYRNNKRTVYLYHIQNKQTDKLTVYALPPWINDYSQDNYPMIGWDKEGNELCVAKPVKGKITIISYTATGSRLQDNAIKNADGITSLAQTGVEYYLLSAYRKGQSDVLSYNISNEKYTPFTNDVYDDSKPALNNSKPGSTFFASTRKEKEPTPEQKRTYGFKDTTKLKQGIYHLQDKIVTALVTDSISYVKWDKPVLLQDGSLLITHTLYGIERFALISNPAAQHPNFKTLGGYRPIQYNQLTQDINYYNADKDSISLYIESVVSWIKRNADNDTTSTWLNDYKKRAAQRAKEDSILKAAKDDTPSFLDGVLVPKDAKEQSKKREDSIAKSQAYDPKKVKPYVLQLHSAYFTAKVNNDYFINRYQPYKNYQGQFKFPELGGMAQGGFTDLLENHHFNIAYRLPAATEGSDLFLRYENTARKIDWSIAYFRKVESLQPDHLRNWTDESGKPYPNNAKVKTHYAEAGTHYPLGYYLSADFTEAVRYDRTIFLATDKYSLPFLDIKALWSITTLSINYNKLKPTLPFLLKGYKAKAIVDVFQPIDGNDGTVTGSTLQLQYHLPVYKYITLVSQLQAGYSGGSNKVLYNIGGLDNNLTVKVDSNVHPQQSAPYAFQTLVTPLRGHLQNTVQGNKYVLANADVYFPVFQTLIPIETPLQSVNLLQPGLFIDAATASETWDKANLSNEKWVWSYGASVRTSLAGYPLRLDVAWPGTFSKKPVWYFSLNLR